LLPFVISKNHFS